MLTFPLLSFRSLYFRPSRPYSRDPTGHRVTTQYCIFETARVLKRPQLVHTQVVARSRSRPHLAYPA